MNKKLDGGPAFPEERRIDSSAVVPRFYKVPGMTLRDYFAAKALPQAVKYYGPCDEFDNHALAAACAYSIADAMIAERSK